VFVLPDEIFGKPTSRVVLTSVDRENSPFAVAGTLDQWRGEVARYCVGNSRLTFFASCAFAGPLLTLLNQAGGGFNLLGKAQTGKSTALRVLASVCGGSPKDGAEGFWRTWRATGNGMEGTAAQFNDGVLCLDEMGLVDAREAGEIAYMLANGQGKARATRHGAARAPQRWRLLFASTGEVSLADKLAEIGRRTQAGQEVRLVDIPADAGAGMGLFEEIHGEDGAGDLAKRLAHATARHYGTAMRAFLRVLAARLAEDAPGYIASLRERVDQLTRDWLASYPTASGQVRSVAMRFAVVAIAGEIASKAQITGWIEAEAAGAAEACFRAFLGLRGTVGAREDAQAVRQLRAFISEHGSARFDVWMDRAGTEDRQAELEETAPHERFRTMKRAGWRRWEPLTCGGMGWRYYLTAEGMAEAMSGLSPSESKRTLLDLGHLVASKAPTDVERGIIPASMRVPGHPRTRLYQVGDGLMETTDSAV
jgi:uncharacterized protein (DUF927 family)